MSREILSGTLYKKDEVWFLNTDGRSILISSSFTIDPALENRKISVIGRKGDMAGSEDTFIAEKIASQEAIAERAHALAQSGRGGSAADNWHLAERELLGVETNGPFSITGTVTSPDGAGLMVKAYDRNIGPDDTFLGQASTDQKGNYSINYTLEQLSGKSAADLVIRIYRDDNLLQTSEVIYNAQPLETRNFAISAPAVSEYQHITDKIKPLLQGKLNVGGLVRDQIVFLNRKTNIEARKIEWLVQSRKLAGANDNLAIFYYAVLSQNLPADPMELLNFDRSSIACALQRAISWNLIPSLKTEGIDRILDQDLPRMRAENLLRPVPAGQPASLGDILNTMPSALPDNFPEKIVHLIHYAGTDYLKLGDQLKKAGLTGEQTKNIERTLRLSSLTCRNIPLMRDLQKLTECEGDSSLKSLAALGRDQWIDKAYAFGVPPWASELSPETYAGQLEMGIEDVHPTAVLAARLSRGDLLISRQGFGEVGVFLSNNPDFHILKTNIPGFLKRANLSEIRNRNQLAESLLKLQRIKKLSATWEEVETFLNNGLDSALQVVEKGREQLKQHLSGQMEPERVEAIYKNAKSTYDLSLALMSSMLPRFSPTPVAAMPTALDHESIRSTLKEFPSLQKLFGSLDYCLCEPYRSVLGPAAYYVDLLQFLRNAGVLECLLKRRPDLVDLTLSFENIEAELPYIDLVLEILENAVALPLKDIPLPAGSSSEDELKQKPLPADISDVLQMTSLQILGSDLKAEKLQKQFDFDGTDVWTVSDGRRRWTLKNQIGGVVLRDGTSSRRLRSADKKVNVEQLAQELGRGQLSPFLKSQVEKLCRQKPGRRYLFISRYSILPLQSGQQWQISSRIGVKVSTSLEGTQGALTLKTPAGENAFMGRYSSAALQATVAGLKDGTVTGILSALVPHSDGAIIDDSGPDISVEFPYDVTVRIEPDTLTVSSLNYQTAGGSDEPAACPENQNPAGYEILRNPEAHGEATFPWSLPFNLPLESVRACLERARVTRRQLIELSRPEHYLNHADWICEVLGLSQEEADIVANPAKGATLWKNWGITLDFQGQGSLIDVSADEDSRELHGQPTQILSKISILLQQSGIDYDDLARILRTRCLSKNGAIDFTFDVSSAECCPSKTQIKQISSGQDGAGILDLLHRFIRLWRKTGWDIYELDMAIFVFQARRDLQRRGKFPVIDFDILKHVARIKYLAEILDLPVKVVITWWSGHRRGNDRWWSGHRVLFYRPSVFYGAPEPATLFEQLFLNPSVQNPCDPDFALNGDKTNLLKPRIKKLSEKAVSISAALGLSQEDFNIFLSLLIQPNSDLAEEGMDLLKLIKRLKATDQLVDNLTHYNLFMLYRTVGLTKALGLSLPDFFRLELLMNASPFDSTQVVIEFCQAVTFIKESGFTPEELSYLLLDEAIPTLPVCLDDSRAAKILKDILSAGQGLSSISGPEAHQDLVDSVLQRVADLFGIEPVVTRRLLISDSPQKALIFVTDQTGTVNDGIDIFLSSQIGSGQKTNVDFETFPEAFQLVRRLHKAAFILKTLKIGADQIGWLSGDAAGMRLLNLNALPSETVSGNTGLFEGWRQLVILCRMRDSAPDMPALLENYIDGLKGGESAQAAKVLAGGLGLSADAVRQAALKLGMTDLAQFQDSSKLQELIRFLSAAKKLGAAAGQIEILAGSSASLDAKAILLARSLLRAKYGSDSWRDVIKPVSQELRIRQRDALVDYLVHREKLSSSNNLYEYYLVDSQISSRMLTSRLVQATAAVQLFVQRCLLNLEEVALNEDERSRWEWIKNYRVWEANRRVFLFPENWLFPELRDDKTQLFKQLESGLAQGELNYQLAKDNVLLYMDDLAEIAKIRVYGMYYDEEGTVYAVGRTPDQPYHYYWRKCENFGKEGMHWYGWERIEIDISDDHVIPFVLEGNFHIAWPSITAKETPDPLSPDDRSRVKNEWEIKLNWARHTNKGWSQKRASRDTDSICIERATDPSAQADPINSITFRPKWQLKPGVLDIFVYALKPVTSQIVGGDPLVYPYFDQNWNPWPSQDPKAPVTTTTVGVQVIQHVGDKYYDAPNYQLTYSLYQSTKVSDGKDHETGKPVYHWEWQPYGSPVKDTADAQGKSTCSLPYSTQAKRLKVEVRDAGGHAVTAEKVDVIFTQGWTNRVEYTENNPDEICYPDQAPGGSLIVWNVMFRIIAQPNSIPTLQQKTMAPLGTFELDVMSDIRACRPAIPAAPDLPVLDAVPNTDFLADGYETPKYLGSDFVSTINQEPVQLDSFTAQHPFFMVEAGKSTQSPVSIGVGYYEDSSRKIYLEASQNDGPQPVWLGICDNIAETASLRSRAYTEFEGVYGFYSLGSQTCSQTDQVFMTAQGNAGWWLPENNRPSAEKNCLFDLFAPSAVYNWEIFYHAPMLIAERLIRNQRFEDAGKWLSFIFNPTAVRSNGSQNLESTRWFWQFLPFRGEEEETSLQNLLEMLARDDSLLSSGFDAKTDRLFAANGDVVYWQAGNLLRKGAVSEGKLDIDNSCAFDGFDGKIDRLFAASGNMVYWQAGNKFRRGTVASGKLNIDYSCYYDGFDGDVDRLFAAGGNMVYWQAGSQFRRGTVSNGKLNIDYSCYYDGFDGEIDCLFTANGNVVYWQAGSQFRKGTVSNGKLTIDYGCACNDFDAGTDRLFAAAGNTVYWQGANQLRKCYVSSGSLDFDYSSLKNFTYQIADWRDKPFSPFAIARYRWGAYKWCSLFAFLDNLIAWGDQMFRRFTRESVNEAIQIYILAAKLLGPRPRPMKSPFQPSSLSYRDLYSQWDDFSNAWYSLADTIPPGQTGQNPGNENGTETLSQLGMLYFCIPHNDKLLEYWDTVEDRLFKIRNCMDIEGAAREFPLFDPPIDPELLVRAVSAGLEIETVISDLYAPLLPYRFRVLLQKASEICAEVKSLGANLLAAMEKEDAERLGLMRSSHEVEVLNLISCTREQQIKEAEAELEILNQSMVLAKERFLQYQKLLGKPLSPLDQSGLPILASSSSLQTAANGPGETAGLGLIQHEVDQLRSLEEAHAYQTGAGIASTISGLLHALPNNISGAMVAQIEMGGSHFGNAAGAVASFLNVLSANAGHEAEKKGLFASYRRRQDEWIFQSKLALKDMQQINKQIAAAEIRAAMAKRELENHKKQIENAKSIYDFVREKYTNRELYFWMVGEISTAYFSGYQLAIKTAKRAEKAFQYELGAENTGFIQYGYWDDLKKGLLSGEKLSIDLKRMEAAYLEQNRRELEITKNISLLQLDPVALVSLKENGACELTIPEALFDIDFPGHYFRRIKSVSLSIPCVAGPYTSVNCTLRLLNHSYRRTAQAGTDDYRHKADASGIPVDDSRFVDSLGMGQAVATSHGLNDSGLFEINFHGERFLPFEGAGVISTWRIELPRDFRQFDYSTISDIIIQIKYTARDGGELLKQKALENLKEALNKFISYSKEKGLTRLLSMKHEFPGEWNNFIREKKTILTIKKDRLPFFAQSAILNSFNLLAQNDFSDSSIQIKKVQSEDSPLNMIWTEPLDNIYKGHPEAGFQFDFGEEILLSASQTDFLKDKDMFIMIGYSL